jgi:aryl-alcohol dehydrogenase-like predicted oxidoreductase
LALSYILSYAEVSTVIPGIKTPEQAKLNTTGITRLSREDLDFIQNLYHEKFAVLMELMEKQG